MIIGKVKVQNLMQMNDTNETSMVSEQRRSEEERLKMIKFEQHYQLLDLTVDRMHDTINDLK